MARAILAQSNRDDVVTMARSIESSPGEIVLMTEMLAQRRAP